ncbi:transporter [Mesorhizobium sp. LHD-90]|uniref:SphA family protein n=1 Tax=Mesorhizobium sp. LHD-90 TaxID=3071414 RepID=UPI0027E1237E|nr:transporter [Mesorhizobium sp. LHD-90]MDQ6436599.1 transporter [Mesorhizobium sp. LHD-90]
MRSYRAMAHSAFLVIAAAGLMPTEAFATEAAMGRYIPGAFAVPGIGILPPMPGVYWQSSNVYYHGEASADLEIPIGGSTQFGLEGDIAATNFTGIWVPGGIELGNNLTFGTFATVPVQYMKVGASLGPLGSDDEVTSLGDIAFGPMLGWHSGTQFLTASLRIFAPTGKYDEGALANNGLNYWTFSPNLAYTYIDTTREMQFDITGGIDINTENPATDYTSGAMAHLDAVLTKSFGKFGVGVFGSILYQFEDDKGGAADQLDGFKGRSFAIGPVVKYTAGTEKNPINFSFSWAPEFGVKNRLEGNGFYLNISGSF